MVSLHCCGAAFERSQVVLHVCFGNYKGIQLVCRRKQDHKAERKGKPLFWVVDRVGSVYCCEA